MTERLLSVGIDLGTTTTQLVFSRLTVENTASSFSVPQMRISRREIFFRGDIHLTPLLGEDRLDPEGLREIVRSAYVQAGIDPSAVQTGAVIITGETARKENAKTVLESLSEFAGRFVVATAGPALESVLAARGAGADRYAKAHKTHVLHMDIGGGTTNLALFDPDGTLLETGCINVGGRLMKFDSNGTVIYRSKVLAAEAGPAVGERANKENLKPLITKLTAVLEEAVGLRQRRHVDAFVTDRLINLPKVPIVLSFSGGVAALMDCPEEDWLRYGDLGVLLADAIRSSGLCRGNHVLGSETVQATAVGAGSYSTVLSGSTVEHHGADFPLHDLPVVALSAQEEDLEPADLAGALEKKLQIIGEETSVLSFRGWKSPTYQQVQRLADGIFRAAENLRPPLVICVREDMAKALGQALRARLGSQTPLICLDGISLQEDCYLDIAAPVGNGTALPVVVKTLAFM